MLWSVDPAGNGVLEFECNFLNTKIERGKKSGFTLSLQRTRPLSANDAEVKSSMALSREKATGKHNSSVIGLSMEEVRRLINSFYLPWLSCSI